MTFKLHAVTACILPCALGAPAMAQDTTKGQTFDLVLVNLDFEWQATNHASVVFGVRNLLDKNYELSEGFPEAGRTFFLTTGVKF